MGRANNTQAPVVTHSTSSRPVPALTGDLNPIIVEEAEVATITENIPIPTKAMNSIPFTGAHHNPAMEGDPTTTEVDHTPIPDAATVPGDTPMPMDEGPTMRLGSMPPPSESELTQLSDTDIS